jgi:cysteinyl-tRNA synthetase
MAIRLHNTLTRATEAFRPIDSANVRMYVCGPTVYDYAHIGNARAVVVFDVLYRLLRHEYGAKHVTYARNITDVDDKIIAAHLESGESIESITRRTAQAFHDDIAALGALPPTVEPRATQHIAEMIALVEDLITKKHAYTAQDHVLFDVTSMKDYGRLSGRNRDELIAGARVEVAPYKKDPADFVLWKPSTTEQPGWDSPWGRGRPGWHLECSAMSEKYLGKTFDIHGGGVDLVFPHHENEIAQSCSAHGHGTFAQTWVHNGFLSVEGEKMSKSLGNFITIRDALKQYHPEVIRLVLLMAHYRQPLDWTAEVVKQAKDALDRWYGALRTAMDDGARDDTAVAAALADDLNTPLAIAALHEMAGDLNKGDAAAAAKLRGGAALIGFLASDPEAWFKWRPEGTAGGLSDADIDAQIAARLAARKAKNYAEADRIRKELADAGITLEDGAGGTTWRRS